MTAPPQRTILILGSSVAAGQCASSGRGWADLLEAALVDRYGANYRVLNAAVGGANTGVTALYAASVGGADLRPDVVVVALGLANEGLPWATDARDVEKLCASFLTGLRAVADAAKRRWGRGIAVIFGGVYPFGLGEGGPGYDEPQRNALGRVHEAMLAWDEPVLPFLSFSGDRQRCRWLPGTAVDVGHPNDRGHRNMFDAVDLDLFAPGAVARVDDAPRRLARLEVPPARRLWTYYGLEKLVWPP